MVWSRRHFLAAVAASGLAVPALAQQPGPLRIGLARTMFRHVPESTFPILAGPFRRLMRDQSGLTGEFDLANDPVALARGLDAGQTQLGVFNGHDYAWLRGRYPRLRPLVVAVGREARPTAVLLVRRDNPAQKADDLAGQAVVLALEARDHCRLFLDRDGPKAVLAASGRASSGKLSQPVFQVDALDAVIDGKLPATVVDGGTLEDYRVMKPGRSEWLRPVAVSEPFPPTILAYRDEAVPAPTLGAIERTLVAARTHRQGKDLMRLWRMKAFEPLPADFDQQLDAVAKRYPPPAEYGAK